MASLAPISSALVAAVESAARELVTVRNWGDTSYINMPLTYPSGTPVTVRVRQTAKGFRVDDGGFAYREIEALGAERSFARIGDKVVEGSGIERGPRTVSLDVADDGLVVAVCDVADASKTIADNVFARLTDKDEAEIEDFLRQRLESIFGVGHVEDAGTIVGSSANEWKVSAIVNTDGHTAVFQAVGRHAYSIYRASTAFHDLLELPTPPRLISVVKDLKSLGPKLSILAQASRVIQSDQRDSDYVRSVQ